MVARPHVILLGALLVACENPLQQPNEPPVLLSYPADASTLLPHLPEGESVRIKVRVLDRKGHPVEGAKVYWDDNRFPTNLNPTVSYSDSAGTAASTWFMYELSPEQYSAFREIRVSLPGARNNPLLYRIEVYRCSRC